MSGALGKSENQSGQSFSQDVWGGQGDALQGLYGSASNLFGSGKNNQQMSGGMLKNENSFDAMQNPWQGQMAGGAYSGMDLTGMMNDASSQLANYDTQTGGMYADIMGGQGNDYVDAMKGSMMADADQVRGLNSAGVDQRAAASGMSGGSRHGVADFLKNQQVDQNLQSGMANLGYESFDKDLQNKLNIAQMADSNKLAAMTQNQNNVANMMGGQQNAMQGGLNFGNNMMGFGNQQQQMPWQNLAMYSNVIGAPTVLGSGSGSSSGKGKSSAGGL